MNMLPGLGGMGMGKMKGLGDEQMDEAEKGMARMEAMIHSMTPAERRDPDLLNPSRKHRIAKGAGVDISEVNRMIKQFNEAKKMMKTFAKPGKKASSSCLSKNGIWCRALYINKTIKNKYFSFMEEKNNGSKNQIKKNGTEESTFYRIVVADSRAPKRWKVHRGDWNI